MEKGNLAKWLKKEGDTVRSGDVIAEIETDKATMEVEAVDEGTLAKIVVPEGTQDVAVNSVIAILAGEGEDAKAVGSAAASAPKPQAKAEAKPAVSAPPAAKPVQQAQTPAPRSEGAERAGSKGDGQTGGRVFASPLAKRLAKDAGLDIAAVQGSGPHGRIIARDVDDAKAGKGLKAPSAAPSAGAAQIAPAMSDQQVRALYEDGSYEVIDRKLVGRFAVFVLRRDGVDFLARDKQPADIAIDRQIEMRNRLRRRSQALRDRAPHAVVRNDFVAAVLIERPHLLIGQRRCNLRCTSRRGRGRRLQSLAGLRVINIAGDDTTMRTGTLHRCNIEARVFC
jgi:pyruvate dehydrogenase E2 component (dihydrolipoamide acetyltransferase)